MVELYCENRFSEKCHIEQQALDARFDEKSILSKTCQ